MGSINSNQSLHFARISDESNDQEEEEVKEPRERVQIPAPNNPDSPGVRDRREPSFL